MGGSTVALIGECVDLATETTANMKSKLPSWIAVRGCLLVILDPGIVMMMVTWAACSPLSAI